MREILFKAKRTGTKEWVEGVPTYPTHEKGKCYMVTRVSCMDDRLGYGNRGNVLLIHDAYEVDPETVGQYTGKKILQNQVTVQKAAEPVKVWQDDLIAIYTVYYDDDDNPVRNKIAVVRVEFDETYQIMYAKCVYGTMKEVVSECNIEYMDGSEDWPFTFWLEYMENSHNQWWEWEIIGNVHDEEDSHDE